MNKRAAIFFWLLLLLPTFVIGGAGFQLLRHESERIRSEDRRAGLRRANTIADSLRLSVAAVEESIEQALRKMPAGGRVDALLRWQQSNPLVRNVFVWRPHGGLEHPPGGSQATAEERRFALRYEPLFAGRVPWHQAAPEASAVLKGSEKIPPSQTSRGAPESRQASEPTNHYRRQSSPRQLVELARKGLGDRRAQVASAAAPRLRKSTGGWIPWFEANRLHILGWVRDSATESVYGVELELMSLLARLVLDFPDGTATGMIYALVDGAGQVLHQSGGAPLKPDIRPELSVSLAPHLPHWQVAVYFAGDGPAPQTGRAFVIIAATLLTILMVAILSGGFLLIRDANRHRLDARRKTTFVSNVSHELRTPLTSIRMYAELLGGGRVRDRAKRQHYLRVISEESQRLARLVNNLLDFSRLEQGRKRYHLQAVDMPALVREVLETHRLRVEAAGLHIVAEVPEAKLTVQTDRDAVEQALVNLIDNAVKYAAGGHELVVELRQGSGHLEVRVMDRGPGIPEAHRERIFDQFHRVDDSLRTSQPGSGLGLSIARRLVCDLGGELDYAPRDGGGSCFSLRLPR